MHTIETNYVETPDTRPETLVHNQNGLIERTDLDRGHSPPQPDEYDRSTGTRHQPVDSDSEDDDMVGRYDKGIYQRPDEQVLHVASTEVQELETFPPTTVTTTTTEPTTTPVPISTFPQSSSIAIDTNLFYPVHLQDTALCKDLISPIN